MTRNASIADFPEAYQRQIAEKLAMQRAPLNLDLTPIAKPSKYRNVKTAYKSVQGFERVYDSKAEARRAEVLDTGIRTGLVRWWLPQVAFPLPGGVRYRCDFLVCWADGRIAVEDVKGKDTQESANKRKQVLACFGVEVEIIR